MRIALFLTALSACLAPAAEPLPSAEAIIERYIEVTGGRAAAEKLRSQVLAGTIEMVGKGITGTAVVYRKAPNKSRSVVEFGGLGKMEEGADGEVAWSLSAMAGPRLKEGAEKRFSLRGADFHGDLRWRDLHDRVLVAGIENVAGRPCYKLVMTPKGESDPIVRYYDKETGLLARVEMTLKSPQGEIPIESVPSDYRKEGEFLIPHKITQRVLGNEIVTVFTRVEINPEIAEDRFTLPKEIEALLKK
jgi:hypothetical protein